MSTNAQGGYITIDAGLKAFATDGRAPKPPLGAAIECATSHCDPTMNLYDVHRVVRGDTLADI